MDPFWKIMIAEALVLVLVIAVVCWPRPVVKPRRGWIRGSLSD